MILLLRPLKRSIIKTSLSGGTPPGSSKMTLHFRYMKKLSLKKSIIQEKRTRLSQITGPDTISGLYRRIRITAISPQMPRCVQLLWNNTSVSLNRRKKNSKYRCVPMTSWKKSGSAKMRHWSFFSLIFPGPWLLRSGWLPQRRLSPPYWIKLINLGMISAW